MESRPTILNSLTRALIRFLLISTLIVPSAMSAVQNKTENPEQAKQEIATEIAEGTQTAVSLESLLLGRNYVFFGRVELEAAAYYGDIPSSENGGDLRRLRVGIAGLATFFDSVSYKFELDLTDGTNNFSDMYVQWDLPKRGALRVGNQLVSQNLSAMTSSLSLLFMEEPLPVSAFSLSRRLAVSYDHDWRRFGLHGMFFTKDPNNNAGKYGWALRVITQPIRGPRQIGHVGFSMVSEKMDREARYRTRPESHVTDIRLVDTGLLDDVQYQHVLGLEMAGGLGSNSMRLELFRSRWERERGRSNTFNGVPKEDGMLQYEYARSALKVGIRLEEKLGANPFKFGMIGSSDTHTSMSTTREDNYFGKLPHYEPSAKRFEDVVLRDIVDKTPMIYTWETSASGLVGVWARENTRESLFDALARKEVYATTGNRITVRLFGGWDFEADEVERQDFARQGYARGVPMGGDLKKAPKGKAPTFMIRAMRDPDNANLDRIQVIKGWLDGKVTHERIYDVACSDGRAIVNRRCDRKVGSTVNVPDASYTNTIGNPLLTAYWKDPDFDPTQRAFYYVRVIEIPKPRWTTYDAKFFGIDMPDEVTMIVQDRAYTSPIWYTS